jgi:ATP-dependent RNA helicase SUPV3L1/SUV3
MVDAESTQGNDALASAPAAPISDWSNVRGFQVLAAAAPEPDASPGDPNARIELEKELAARAARFTQSVDDSIVLASDGVIRWLGDPVARLIAGEDLLRPKAVLLADEALPAEGREAVQTRLGLWVAAHISKVLGPLEALAEPGGAVAEPVRALGNRIAQALGVLERERVRQQVKTLDQSARSALRKLGVRFGSMYIFVPALLKPGARTLCSQLWGLRRGEAGAERLLTFAAAGRTSFAAEAPLAADTYRVAGFRLCGDRVVRIDIVERLNDLIRAAIPDHMRPGGPPASEASGFLVSPQMTSLTGCAGESFASILRSLGYESHRVKRSEFEAANRKPIASMNPIEAPTIASAGIPEAGHAEATASDETAPESDGADVSTPAAESDLAKSTEAVEAPIVAESAAVEPIEMRAVEPDDGETETPDFEDVGRGASAAVPETAPVEAIETRAVERDAGPTPAFKDVGRGATTAVPETTAPVEAIETPVVEPEEDGESPPFEDVGRSATAAVSETALVEAIETQAEEVDLAEGPAVTDLSPVDALETPPVGAMETPTVEVGEAGAEPPPPEDEWVEVWRPAPRRRPQPAPRPSAPYAEREAASPRQARDPRRRWTRDAASSVEASAQDAARVETLASVTTEASLPAASEGPREVARPEGGAPSRQDRGPRRSHKGPRSEPARTSDPARVGKETPNTPVKKEQRPQPIDMDSPFAKLLALKPLLERRDKRT